MDSQSSTVDHQEKDREADRLEALCTPHGAVPFGLAGEFLPCYVAKVYDGDSITVHVPWHGRLYRHGLRLWGIDTPELRTRDPEEKAAGVRARDYLRGRVLGKVIWVAFEGLDKYGRFLGHLYDTRHRASARTLNAELINLGHAQHYTGKSKVSYREWQAMLALEARQKRKKKAEDAQDTQDAERTEGTQAAAQE